jgi:hypothetical protein
VPIDKVDLCIDLRDRRAPWQFYTRDPNFFGQLSKMKFDKAWSNGQARKTDAWQCLDERRRNAGVRWDKDHFRMAKTPTKSVVRKLQIIKQSIKWPVIAKLTRSICGSMIYVLPPMAHGEKLSFYPAQEVQ